MLEDEKEKKKCSSTLSRIIINKIIIIEKNKNWRNAKLAKRILVSFFQFLFFVLVFVILFCSLNYDLQLQLINQSLYRVVDCLSSGIKPGTKYVNMEKEEYFRLNCQILSRAKRIIIKKNQKKYRLHIYIISYFYKKKGLQLAEACNLTCILQLVKEKEKKRNCFIARGSM